MFILLGLVLVRKGAEKVFVFLVASLLDLGKDRVFYLVFQMLAALVAEAYALFQGIQTPLLIAIAYIVPRQIIQTMTHLPNTYSHPITKDLSYDFLRIPAGEFMMGSEDKYAFSREGPVHKVRITQDFYMGKFLVTQDVWSAVMNGHNPSEFKGNRRPVERVSWQDIVEGGQGAEVPESFLARLNEHYLIGDSALSNWRFRLPTETEWEYAARADTSYKYAGSDQLKQVGWFYANSHNETKEVSRKLPNAFGLYDMCGNVREWCQDRFDSSFYEQCKEEGLDVHPVNNRSGDRCVLRGGSWDDYPQFCRVSYRFYGDPTFRSYDIGFRLVLAPSSAG